MSLQYNEKLISRAKELRRNMTKQEKHLWYDFLCTYPVRFQRQKTIDNFIVDFYCHKAKLVVELDGSQHYTDDGVEYDSSRSDVLARYDLEVIRFSNTEVDRNFAAVCDAIDEKVKQRAKTPSAPCGGTSLKEGGNIAPLREGGVGGADGGSPLHKAHSFRHA